jgi:hypothetical protein
MSNAFRGISLLVDVGLDRSEPHGNVLLHPAKHEPARSRVVLHETIHYWQQLNLGFLTRLAEEDAVRLRRYEQRGALDPPGPVRLEYVRRYPGVEFSARDLHESIARYWDVHVIGPNLLLELELEDPHRRLPAEIITRYRELKRTGRLRRAGGDAYSDLSYDLAMEAAAGRYALPYLEVRRRFAPAVAGGVFPVAGNLAMHTARPVPFFVRLAELAAPVFEAPLGRDIEDVWRGGYEKAAGLAGQLAGDLGERLEPFPLLVQDGTPLTEWMPHDWVRHRLGVLIDGLANTDRVRKRAAQRGIDPNHAALQELAFMLCCPGIAENRGTLAAWLAPPVVRFADGGHWLLGELYRRQLVPEVDESERRLSAELERVADEVERLDERWQQFLKAAVRQGLPPLERAPEPYSSAFFEAARVVARMPRRRDPRLGQWLVDVLSPVPPAGPPLEHARSFYWFARSMLRVGPVREEDVRAVVDMLLMQLA